MSAKVYETITKVMIEKIEARRAAGDNRIPWRMTWNPTIGAPRNLVSDKPYRGSNLFLTMFSGHSNPYWVTAKQCAELGGHIKSGERYTPIVYWNFPTPADKAEAAAKGRKAYPFVRFYQAWNVTQTEGLEALLIDKLEALQRPTIKPIDACEQIVNRWTGRPTIQHGGSQACYIPTRDEVRMPVRDDFNGAAEYYHTLFHELTHSTGHPSRLEREGVSNPVRFGSHLYSAEELIAEMGASMLSSIAGIEVPVIDNAAAYLDGWLARLKAEPSWLVQSGAAAQKAVDLIQGISWAAAEHEKAAA